MASPFGAAPAAGGGLFGSPFGATPATPGFGSPAPAFGAAAASAPASAPAFSFSTPTSGASAPGLFGATAAASTPSTFGASTASSLFGASSAPSLFGGSSAPSLFGASSASAFGASPFGGAASSPSLFGGATAAGASAPAPGSSPFGSLFGSAPASSALTAPATGGLFGGSQMAPASFNNPVGLPSTAAADSAVREIAEIKAAYTPGQPSYKFQYVLLNVVDNPAQRVKPPGIDEMRWRQALAAAGGPNNPDRLWPVAANGFKDLTARSAAQAAALDENTARLKSLQDLAYRLAKRQGTELKQRATAIQSQHLELAARLLRVCRTLDALESRLAASIGYRADVARSREETLSRQLKTVEGELAPGSLTGLARRLEAVATAAQLRSGQPVSGAHTPAGQPRLDERSSAQLLAVLRDHADGIAKLQALLKRDAQDVAIMRQELGGDDGGPGGPGGPGQPRGMLLD